MKIKIFYSYSHKNLKYKDEINKTLATLKKKNLISEWHDRNIIPGQSISSSIQKELDSSHIYLFLLSRDFIASEPCNDEWNYVKNKISNNRYVYRVPIIVKNCTWKDFLENDDVKSLPNDGKSIDDFPNKNNAYMQIYNGIKQVIEDYQKSFVLKKDFLEEFEKTDFASQESINIKDLFVFPELSLSNNLNDTNSIYVNIKNEKELLKNKFIIINGEESSGKTILCKHLFLSCIEKELPVLFVDLKDINNKKAQESVFARIYENQFNGSYDYWKIQTDKTIVFDNLSNIKYSLDYVQLAIDTFANVIVTVSTDEYRAFFQDDDRLIKFSEVKINELTHVKQEELIKSRLSFIDKKSITREQIDHAEEKVNSVIRNNILPRYPFYILSILQTLEVFMPNDIEISSYGHCYKVLIISNLVKSGIDKDDSSLNTCFKFLENLAFARYESNNFSFNDFKKKYQVDYLIKDNLINRLSIGKYALIELDGDGRIKQDYVYYYFLGSYFAKNRKDENKHIEAITNKNYLKQNNLILLFIIHHTVDHNLIDDVLLYSMCAFDDIPKATLDIDETSVLSELVSTIPSKIISSNSVDKERKNYRSHKDNIEKEQKNDNNYDGSIELINDIYKILKNNELFAQILRNHYGDLKQTRITEIINVIIDSGLRLVKLFLDKKRIAELIEYIHKKKPNAKLKDIKRLCKTICFIWVIENIERIVGSIRIEDIQGLVTDIVEKESTPAYDLIGYFSKLDSAKSFHDKEKNHFNSLYDKHKEDKFIQRIISLRTQMYLNTHDVNASIEQSIYSTIGIKYTPRLKKWIIKGVKN